MLKEILREGETLIGRVIEHNNKVMGTGVVSLWKGHYKVIVGLLFLKETEGQIQ